MKGEKALDHLIDVVANSLDGDEPIFSWLVPYVAGEIEAENEDDIIKAIDMVADIIPDLSDELKTKLRQNQPFDADMIGKIVEMMAGV